MNEINISTVIGNTLAVGSVLMAVSLKMQDTQSADARV